MRIVYGALLLSLLFGGGLLLWPTEEIAITPPKLPVVTVDQLTLGGTTLTVQGLYVTESGLTAEVILVSHPGCDPRIIMPWYLTDQEGNTYPSRHAEHRSVLDEQGELMQDRRHLTVHFPTYTGDGQNLALQARIKHEHWQVKEGHQTELDFLFPDVAINGADLKQSNGGLTVEASTACQDGTLLIDVKLVALDVQIWEALRQPQLKIVDEEGNEYVPSLASSTTQPVGPGDSPTVTTIYWHYVVAAWPVEAEQFDLYYELTGSFAPPEEMIAEFSGLHITAVE